MKEITDGKKNGIPDAEIERGRKVRDIGYAAFKTRAGGGTADWLCGRMQR